METQPDQRQYHILSVAVRHSSFLHAFDEKNAWREATSELNETFRPETHPGGTGYMGLSGVNTKDDGLVELDFDYIETVAGDMPKDAVLGLIASGLSQWLTNRRITDPTIETATIKTYQLGTREEPAIADVHEQFTSFLQDQN